MWMPHPIERVKRDAMAGTSGVLESKSVVYVSTYVRYVDDSTSFTFDFPASNTMPAREGPENGKAEAQPVFSISGGAFSDLLKGHQSLEDPKTHQVAQWRWRFFGSRGKKTNRGLRFERFSTERRFDEAPQVR